MITLSLKWAHVNPGDPQLGDQKRLIRELLKGIKVYVSDPAEQRACMREVEGVFESVHSGAVSSFQLSEKPESMRLSNSPKSEPGETVRIEIHDDDDVVRARTSGRNLCREMGFSSIAQVKVATAISELARNIVQYAGEGEIRICRLAGHRIGVEVEAFDHGPGIPDQELVMSTRYRSRTGMGIGLKGAKRLTDEFSLDSAPDSGTRVIVRKYLDD
jgi:serine/threonine-protein kinase RsbT